MILPFAPELDKLLQSQGHLEVLPRNSKSEECSRFRYDTLTVFLNGEEIGRYAIFTIDDMPVRQVYHGNTSRKDSHRIALTFGLSGDEVTIMRQTRSHSSISGYYFSHRRRIDDYLEIPFP
ncbi:MAG: hypothetical protein EPN86_02280 [Nanoarchaeota archaeon]|nr:MAG: hypothetical protein EPN86_02280 [Nanoarchaeota archaeon]